MVGYRLWFPCLGEESDSVPEGKSLAEFQGLLTRPAKRVTAHPMRWCVLALYCATSFMQVVVWNTWGPIARSAFVAFPSWGSHTITLLTAWGTLVYLICIVPFCWLLSKYGLRTSFLIACALAMVSTAVRCFGTSNEKIFTVFAHIGAVLNSMSGVILCPAPAMLSALWFPQDQRTSATGIGAALNQLGMAGSYLIGPLIVTAPSNNSNRSETVTSKLLQSEIATYMLIDFLIFAVISTLMFILFPERPPRPPSRTAVKERYDFKTAITTLLWSWNMFLLSTSAAMCQGVTGPWLSMMTVIFSSRGVTQEEADKLGIWTVLCSCFMGIAVARMSDLIQGYLKVTLIALIASSAAMFLWVLLLTTQAIPFHKTCLYVAVLLGVSFSWSTPALFFELASEIAYPIPEGIVGGYIAALSNVYSAAFFFVYFIPGIGIMWMNYCLFIYSLLSVVAITMVEEQYNRLEIEFEDYCYEYDHVDITCVIYFELKSYGRS